MRSLDYCYESASLDCHLRQAMGEKPLGHFYSKAFDDLIGGIYPARLVVLCAEPGMAKTTLMGQLVDEAAMAGFVCVVNTLEVPAHQWVAKSLARLSNGELTVADIANPEKEFVVDEISEIYRKLIAPNVVFVERALCPTELGAIVAKVQAERENPVMFFQDYLQIMPAVMPTSGQPIADERLAVKEAVSGLRKIANAHRVPVFAISSINRASYAKTANLSSLGGSSAVEYGVDTVVHMTIEGAGEERELNMNLPIRPIVVSILKNRYGPKGSAKLSFDSARATFTARH